MDRAHNRAVLGSHLGLVVIVANARMQRSNDTFYPFEQEANFWYLTGIEEPDWLLILDGTAGKSWLVAPDVDATHHTFDGSLDATSAKAISCVDAVLTHDEGQILLGKLAKKHSVVHTIGEHPDKRHFNFVLNPAQHQLQSQLERTFRMVRDCRLDLAKQRAIKQPDEIKAMQQAIKLTVEAFEHVKSHMREYQYEYQVAAEYDYWFARANASHAYDPIVAAGGNACTLHYVKNDSRLKSRQMVLIDIGARVNGYAADITRTYAYGAMTRRQVEVYQALQYAQQEIIKLLVPGLPITEYIASVDSIMQRSLIELGLITDKNDEKYHLYFPHSVSHGLGIDVHDSLGRPEVFAEGMVLTVEPGIYIPAEAIGTRIEDDILITHSGHVNLSKSLSTEPH